MRFKKKIAVRHQMKQTLVIKGTMSKMNGNKDGGDWKQNIRWR